MTILADLVMFGWLPVVIGMFYVLPPRRAVIAGLLIGWLFLPNATYSLPGLPDYDKVTATVVGVLFGAMLRDSTRLMRFRLSAMDLPIAVLCLSPFVTSLSNDLGAWHGISQILSFTISWGLPYLIGRLYFSDLEGMRELAIGIFIGGLLYVPFCLWEIRMSPQLHLSFYGFRTRSFSLAVRYGGFRPMVFLWSFLPVVLWMSLATVAGARLWLGGRMRSLMGVPMSLLVLTMVATTVLCKTFIAFGIIPLGWLLPPLIGRLRTVAPLVLICLGLQGYLLVRAAGVWTPTEVVEFAASIDEDRAQSLQTRFENEDRMAARAALRPLFGWGGFGRARVIDEETGKDITLSDGLWISVFGNYGYVGLLAFMAVFTLPLLRLAKHMPASAWQRPSMAPVTVVAMMVLMTIVYNALNTARNPIVVVCIGGLALFGASRALRVHSSGIPGIGRETRES